MALTSFFDDPDDAPMMERLKLRTANDGLTGFLGQRSMYGDLQGFANEINTGANQGYRNSLYEVSPNLQTNVQQLGKNTESLLKGELPEDVQALVRNTAAFKNLNRGVAGSKFGDATVARDLGLTSLDLMNQGSNYLNQQMNLSSALTPSKVTGSQFLFTPQSILQRYDAEDQYNNKIDFANKNIAFANGQQESGFDTLLGNTVASTVSSPFNFTMNANNVAASSPQFASAGFLSSLCGNGSGGGGSPSAGNGSQYNMSSYNQNNSGGVATGAPSQGLWAY